MQNFNEDLERVLLGHELIEEEFEEYQNAKADAISFEPMTDNQKKDYISRSLKKLGRNSRCPCGSGRKYKKCHMGKDTQHA